MTNIIESLQTRKNELEINIKKIETQIATLPQGKLYVRKNGKYYNYYQVDQNGKRSYIPRKEIESIRNLAQRKYAEKVQKELKNEYAIIKKTLKTCIAQNVRMVYQTMPEGIRTLISPVELSDEEYAERWLKQKQETQKKLHEQEEKNKKYVMNSYQAPKELENENGEQFRSKSETIIAEKLKNNKIPYIYEYPLKLKNGKTIYPDFYILNKRTRETYYYEHFGMMDDPEYCINALRKIDDYARNEIHIGQKLLVTFEAIEKPLSIKTLEELIKNNLI